MGVAIEALNWRVVVTGSAPEFTMSSGSVVGAGSSAAAPTKGTRKAYFPDSRGYVETPVYDRYALRPGAAV